MYHCYFTTCFAILHGISVSTPVSSATFRNICKINQIETFFITFRFSIVQDTSYQVHNYDEFLQITLKHKNNFQVSLTVFMNLRVPHGSVIKFLSNCCVSYVWWDELHLNTYHVAFP